MNYWNKICGFTTLFFIPVLFCNAQVEKKSLLPAASNNSVKIYSGLLTPKIENKNSIVSSEVVNTIASNYYMQHLGFFCKKEIMLEKAVKIPIRIRLGSLQQCNYLEGKK
jgi:hypothetical protein